MPRTRSWGEPASAKKVKQPYPLLGLSTFIAYGTYYDQNDDWNDCECSYKCIWEFLTTPPIWKCMMFTGAVGLVVAIIYLSFGARLGNNKESWNDGSYLGSLTYYGCCLLGVSLIVLVVSFLTSDWVTGKCKEIQEAEQNEPVDV